MYAIAAAALDWAIGKGGDQLCYIPADLKRFKALTTGHAVILGRRTLATLDRKSTRLNSSHESESRMPSSA